MIDLGKLLKKSCFILLISCFIGLGNFSSANEYGIGTLDDYNNSYVLSNGFLKTVIDGQDMNFFRFQSKTWRRYGGLFWNDDKLYCFIAYNDNSGINQQGYALKYGVCNNVYTNCLYPGNFSYSDYDEEYVGEFLNNIDTNDLYTPRDYDTSVFLLLHDLDTNVSISLGCSTEFNAPFGSGNLIQNYTGFNSLSNSFMGNPPGQETEEETTQGNRNNNNYYCPTIGQLLNNYGKNYSTGLCYNSTLYYNNQTNQLETIEKKDIFTVFSGFDEFKNRVSIYNNNCKAPATQQNCSNAFSGEFEKYSIIGNATDSNVIIKDLWNYCNMSLNYDTNWSTCVASGYIQEQPTEEEFLEMITNGEITKINTPGTGNILNNLLGTGQTRDDIATRDILGQIDQLKEKLASIFNERNGTNGIIPDYIMWLILTTLLLTVLIKK